MEPSAKTLGVGDRRADRCRRLAAANGRLEKTLTCSGRARVGTLDAGRPCPDRAVVGTQEPAPPPGWPYEQLRKLPERLLRKLCDQHLQPDPAAAAALARLPLDTLYRRFRLELLEQGGPEPCHFRPSS
jgi:hypothetical protein